MRTQSREPVRLRKIGLVTNVEIRLVCTECKTVWTTTRPAGARF
jgi:hypothetical protein